MSEEAWCGLALLAGQLAIWVVLAIAGPDPETIRAALVAAFQ